MDGGIGAAQNANFNQVADQQQKAEELLALVNSLRRHAAEQCSGCVNVTTRLGVVWILEKALLFGTYTTQNNFVKIIPLGITMFLLA